LVTESCQNELVDGKGKAFSVHAVKVYERMGCGGDLPASGVGRITPGETNCGNDCLGSMFCTGTIVDGWQRREGNV
jgi:hypothetical protein